MYKVRKTVQQVGGGGIEYCMYVLFQKGVHLYSYIDKEKFEHQVILDGLREKIDLTPGCADCDKNGYLLIDTTKKTSKGEDEHQLRWYLRGSLDQEKPLDGPKQKVQLFRKNMVVEVKAMNKGKQELCIHNFKSGITVYWTQLSHARIHQVAIENDIIYYLAEDSSGLKTLQRLFEQEDNVKIHTLMKRKLFENAKEIAVEADFPKDIIAEIDKEHGDKLYNESKLYGEAMDQYIQTIGYLNPSYVIQRYIGVNLLDHLIRYLEKFLVSSDK